MGAYADAFGDWARATRDGDNSAQADAFRRMEANSDLHTANAGRDLARGQMARAQTHEGRDFASEHERVWTELHDRLVLEAADKF